MSITSPLTRPSPNGRRVGIRIVTFEACSGFTRVTARRIAQLPKATFVTRLQPLRLPARAARQLPDQSTTLRVESSSTGNPRLRGALPKPDIAGLLFDHLVGNSEQARPGSGTIAGADGDDRLRACCSRRCEDGKYGQELRTTDRSLHSHHWERDRNLRRSRHRDWYRMVYLSPTAAADIRAGRRHLQDPHRSIALARPRGARGGRHC